jgi:hydrogenase/urease accessory protein HupE
MVDLGMRDRTSKIAVLIGFEAATLAVIASLHLGHVLAGGRKPFRPTAAGIAEAIIGIVLVYGAVALNRGSRHAWGIALAAVAFAIAGFLLGLTFTLRGGDAIDIAYHATMLPLLLLTLIVLLRGERTPVSAKRVKTV